MLHVKSMYKIDRGGGQIIVYLEITAGYVQNWYNAGETKNSNNFNNNDNVHALGPSK